MPSRAVSSVPKRGRPREFDRDAALRRAMELFWRHGYEGTSLAELTAAMDINKPSLYAAFGSKELLFREAITLYDATDGSATHRALNEKTARAAVESMLRGNAEFYAQAGKPSGCMIVLAAALGSDESESARRFVVKLRRESQRALEKRFDRAVAEGDLPRSVDRRSLAAFYMTILNGLSVQARDGAGREELHDIVDRALAAWEGLAAAHARPQQRVRRRKAR
jgi:AcrR family transcriptional regulator